MNRPHPKGDEAARLLPALRTVDLDGGHPINLDQPEAFNAAVRGFLQRCPTL
jgi:pimeloyl-ACP methyl ester carboxylesterase